MKIGIISDTHNYLDPLVLQLFQGVDHILHGGDVGLMSIIYALESIAPVTAVFGNTDSGLPLKETESIELGGRRFLLHHIVVPMSPVESLRRRIEKERPNVVVFGHTHKPYQETIGETLYFNPGYAGKQRFSLPRSVAIMDIRPKDLSIELRWL
jgi:putative phosphoesterase